MNGFYWLASYPKSGNTWLRLAMQSLEQGGRSLDFGDQDSWYPIASSRDPLDGLLDIESSDLTADEVEGLRPELYRAMAAQADVPMIRKVHDAWTFTSLGEPVFPPEVSLGAIYIVRDPRDVAISYAHHACCSIDDSIAFLGNPSAAFANSSQALRQQLRQILKTWSEHVTSWLDAPGLRVLPVRYEDMAADAAGALTLVANFLGWRPEAETVAAATAATRFDVLKKNEERNGFRGKPVAMKSFFREGKAQGWSSVLSGGQAARIERDHAEVMMRLGYL